MCASPPLQPASICINVSLHSRLLDQICNFIMDTRYPVGVSVLFTCLYVSFQAAGVYKPTEGGDGETTEIVSQEEASFSQ